MPETKQPKVIFHAVNDCHFCDVLRDVLIKHKIKFEEVIWDREDEDIEEKFKKLTDQTFVRFPVTEIDGVVVISLDMFKIDKLLGLTGEKVDDDDEIELEETTQ